LPRTLFLLVLCVLLLARAPHAAPASQLRAQATAVAFDDGDSFDVRIAGRGRLTVRLHAVDAPEREQPHGEAARRGLIAAIGGRPLRLDCYKRDARGRYVCRVWVGGEDLQHRLLLQGHAWHYTMYLGEQTAAERSQYAQAQRQARAGRRGLWKQQDPMPPWTCRIALRRLRPCR
jgi:endonuclease YncB( thermonuclease family)